VYTKCEKYLVYFIKSFGDLSRLVASIIENIGNERAVLNIANELRRAIGFFETDLNRLTKCLAEGGED